MAKMRQVQARRRFHLSRVGAEPHEWVALNNTEDAFASRFTAIYIELPAAFGTRDTQAGDAALH